MEGAHQEESENWLCVCGDGQCVNIDPEKICSFSGYFSAMRTSGMKETYNKQVHLDLISSNTLKTVLKMLATERNANSELSWCKTSSLHLMENVLKAVDYLDIPCLYQQCCEILISQIPKHASSDPTLCRLLDICDKFKLITVQKDIYKYYAINLSRLLKEDPLFYCKMSQEMLSGVLSHPYNTLSSELAVMEVIKDWYLHAPETRKSQVKPLLECIHLPSLLPKENHKIIKILNGLHIDSDLDVEYLCYIMMPHKYIKMTRKYFMELRNGREILLMISGLNVGRKNMSQKCHHGLSMQYQMLDKVRKCCTVGGLRYNNSHNQGVISLNSDKNSVNKGVLTLKPVRKTSPPTSVVEFGVCVYENFVYVAGGQSRYDEESNRAERLLYRYSCHSGDWQPLTFMQRSRCLFYMCAAWDRIYMVGGVSQYGHVLNEVECYDPVEERWLPAQNLPEQLHEHTGCVHNNKMYICGGHTDTQHTEILLVLDSPDSTWHTLAPMLQPRSYHAMAAVSNNLYVFGGCCRHGDIIKDLYSVDQYSIEQNTWTHVMDLDYPVNASLPVLIDEEVMFVGTHSFNDDQFLQQTISINPVTKKWRVSTHNFVKLIGYQCLSLKISKRLITPPSLLYL